MTTNLIIDFVSLSSISIIFIVLSIFPIFAMAKIKKEEDIEEEYMPIYLADIKYNELKDEGELMLYIKAASMFAGLGYLKPIENLEEILNRKEFKDKLEKIFITMCKNAIEYLDETNQNTLGMYITEIQFIHLFYKYGKNYLTSGMKYYIEEVEREIKNVKIDTETKKILKQFLLEFSFNEEDLIDILFNLNKEIEAEDFDDKNNTFKIMFKEYKKDKYSINFIYNSNSYTVKYYKDNEYLVLKIDDCSFLEKAEIFEIPFIAVFRGYFILSPDMKGTPLYKELWDKKLPVTLFTKDGSKIEAFIL